MPIEIAADRFAGLAGEASEMPFLSGLRSDVLSALATRPALKVYASSFHPEPHADYGGHVLSVAAVRTEERLHGLLSLRAPDGTTQADTFELARADIARAARRIADRAVALLDGAAPPVARPEAVLSQAAYEHLLLARHHAGKFTPADNDTARRHFREVLAEVPDHAPALAGLAASTFQQIRYGALDTAHYPAVLDAAERALDADPGAVQAHVVRALVAMYHDRDLRAAADAFGDALALDRDHVDVLGEYVWLLCATGHDAEAVAAIERALEYDPLSIDLICTKADLHRYADDPTAALALYRRAHALDLRYGRAIEGLASMASVLGDRDEAFRYLDLYRRHAPARFLRFRPMGEIAARFGDAALHAEAVRQLDAYAQAHPEADLSGDLASVLATTDPDRAMRHLADAYLRGIGIVSVLRYAVFDPLRERDDYRQLVADLDLDIDVPEVAAARTRLLHFPDGASETLALPKTAVVMAEAQRNYVEVHAARGARRSRHLLRTSLSAVLDGLRDDDLVRVHHSFAVNLALPGWRLEGNAHTAALRLDRLDVEVPVSRARYTTVRDALAV